MKYDQWVNAFMIDRLSMSIPGCLPVTENFVLLEYIIPLEASFQEVDLRWTDFFTNINDTMTDKLQYPTEPWFI
jgi:hypothetical protein